MKRIAAVVVLALALTGCSSGARHSAAPPSPASPATSATTIDPTVIPPVITIDYLNAVLARLDHVYGDAVREFVAKRDVTPDVNVRLRAIYDDPLYQEQLKIFSSGIAESFSNYRNPPGDQRTTVTRILSASSLCAWLQVTTDYSAVTVTSQDVAASEYLGLHARDAALDPMKLNSTPWTFGADATYRTPTPPPADPCVRP